MGLSLNENSTVSELREQLSSDTSIPESCMLLTQIDDLGFQRTFSGQLPISEIKETDPVYCIETPQLKDASEEMEKYILLCWVNVLTMDDHSSRLMKEKRKFFFNFSRFSINSFNSFFFFFSENVDSEVRIPCNCVV
mgnify:CR=1 FL=1